MSKLPAGVLVLAALVLGPGTAMGAPPPTPSANDAPIPDIPYEKVVLPNGLTVILHEDHKAPIVAVNVWYHVGSKNERPGKTGFAHLFEHLMFNGSENADDDYFKPMERIGATDLNGTTNVDRTNYFQNVPSSALDVALFMESDRMGHLLKAIDQAKLDEQRGVVQNEKRQGENQPYGITRTLLSNNTYPKEHPYHWTTIGEMEDLQAASLEDVHTWFSTHYGPNNAVLVVAGDIDPAEVKAKVATWFGDIPPGPPGTRHARWVAKMTGEHRQVVQDRVPQARVYKVWNVPEWGAAEADYLDLLADVLAEGKSSRLYKRLVYDDQIATDVNAFLWAKEIGGQLQIAATARPGSDLKKVEQALDEELARLLADGPTAAELERVKAIRRADFIRGAERIGGFGGKSDILASNMVYGGDPHFYKTTVERMTKATPEDLRRTARAWLADGVYVLEVHPYPTLRAAGAGADRSALPPAGDPPAPAFPALEKATLANGLTVVLARRDAVPMVNVRLLVDAGYAADHGGIQGTAALTMDMLDEGAGNRSSLAISDELDRLGAELRTGASIDACEVSLSALKATLDPALELFADVVLAPTFPAADLERLKAQQIARVQREKANPMMMGQRVLPALLFGPGHAYSVPSTGSGTEASVARIGRDDVAAFHRTWFVADNATLVVVGAVSMEEIRPRLERLLGGWRPGQVPAKAVGPVPRRAAVELFLIDKPGAPQSMVLAGQVAPPASDPDEIAIDAANRIFGGSFTSRVNMNLREGKHWTYGARSSLVDTRGPRPLVVGAPVQADKTAETIQEIIKEMKGMTGEIPITAEELEKTRAGLLLTLPGRWETLAAVTESVAEIVELGLPHDYFVTYPAAVRALDVPGLTAVSRRVLTPGSVAIVVVGDRAKVEGPLAGLGLGPVHVIDADGQPVPTA